MESLHPFSRTHWDHEPELHKPLEIHKTILSSWKASHDYSAAHRDHEPRAKRRRASVLDCGDGVFGVAALGSGWR
jgi:hypothetical protein